MGVGALVLVIVLVQVVRLATEGRQRKPQVHYVVAGTPRGLPLEGPDNRGTLPLRARWHLLFSHRARSRRTPSALMRARRYSEASTAIAPHDHKRRGALAIRRQGPIPDLLLAARGGFGRKRDAARAILTQLYPGEPWGFQPTASLGVEDAVGRAYLNLSSRTAHLKLRAAARLARQLRRAYPEADTRHQTLFDLACLEALRGRADASRKATVDLANSDAPRYLRDQASRISQRIAAAKRKGNKLESLVAQSPTAATKTVRDLAKSRQLAWPVTPRDLDDLIKGTEDDVTDRTLDIAAIAQNLAQGHDVWVAVLDATGSPTVVPVNGVESISQVLLLADGVAMDLDALRRASVWGSRMLVVHPKGATVAGTGNRASFRQIQCPRAADGQIDHAPNALRLLRTSVRSHPADALASYLYALALVGAERAGGNTAYDAAEHRRHLAISAARFPDVNWPLVFLAARAEDNGDARPGALLTVGLANTLTPGANAPGSRAYFDVDNADALLRDDLATFLTRFDKLEEAAHRAAARQDGKDFDAHLDLLQRVAPHHESMPHLRQVREVVWRGPTGALKAVQGGRSDPDAAWARLRLAAQTGSHVALRTHATAALETSHKREPRDARVLLALHAGDYPSILEQAAAVTVTDGVSAVLTGALVTSAETFADRHDTSLVAALDFAITNGDREIGGLTGGLMTRRPEVAIAILRAKTTRPGDPIDTHGRLARTLIHHASQAAPAEREALAREALASLAHLEPAKSTIPAWDAMSAAAWRLIDPDRAFEALTGIDHLRTPLADLLLAAAIASDRGDHDLAHRMVARAANPEFIRAGLAWATHMGIDAEVNLVMSRIDVSLVRAEAWWWLGAGGELPSLPRAPLFGELAVPERALWALLARGEYDLARQAVLHKWPPQSQLDFADGAPRAAITAAIAALTASPRDLREALATSKHPAFLRAGLICAQRGIDVGLPLAALTVIAPGLKEEVTA